MFFPHFKTSNSNTISNASFVGAATAPFTPLAWRQHPVSNTLQNTTLNLVDLFLMFSGVEGGGRRKKKKIYKPIFASICFFLISEIKLEASACSIVPSSTHWLHLLMFANSCVSRSLFERLPPPPFPPPPPPP